MIIRGDATRIPLPDCSVDAVVTDPPYGLEFMGKEWDSLKAPAGGATFTKDGMGKGFKALPVFNGSPNPSCRNCGGTQRGQDRKGFTRCRCDAPDFPNVRRNQAVAAQHWHQLWAAEALRVLRPGGHLLAFGGTRTYHRMTCAIEDAGFEVRDCLAWLYGSGFPKSLDVSKALDKRRVDEIAHVGEWLATAIDQSGVTRKAIGEAFGLNPRQVDQWAPRLTDRSAIERAHVPTWEQWLRLRELLGFGDEMDAEVWRLNGRKGKPGEAWDQREIITTAYRGGGHGMQALGPVGFKDGEFDITAPATPEAEQWQGWGTALKPAHEPIVLARKPLTGTVASNVLRWGTGALNIDATRVGEPDGFGGGAKASGGFVNGYESGDGFTASTQGRWPPNVAMDEEAARLLDEQSGTVRSAGFYDKGSVGVGEKNGAASIPIDVLTSATYGDTGGASRFMYVAKASRRERAGSSHPTHKPEALMRWLCRLVTPPGGLILDPFLGSGTTLLACAYEGMRGIGIEREAEYVEIAKGRLSQPIQAGML